MASNERPISWGSLVILEWYKQLYFNTKSATLCYGNVNFGTEMLQKNNIKNRYLLHWRRLHRITNGLGSGGPLKSSNSNPPAIASVHWNNSICHCRISEHWVQWFSLPEYWAGTSCFSILFFFFKCIFLEQNIQCGEKNKTLITYIWNYSHDMKLHPYIPFQPVCW